MTTQPTGVGLLATPPPQALPTGLPQTPGFSFFSPSTWGWSTAPAQPSQAMQDLQAATRGVAEALQTAANVASGSVTEGNSGLTDATNAVLDEMQNMQIEGRPRLAEVATAVEQRIGAGGANSPGSGSAFSFESISDGAEELLRKAQESIKLLSDQNTQLQLELAETRSRQATAEAQFVTNIPIATQLPAADTAHALQLSDDQYTGIIRKLNEKLTKNTEANRVLQKRVEELQRLRDGAQQVSSFLGPRIDAYVRVFRAYYNEKSPVARAGIMGAITLAAGTVLYGVAKITTFATSAISEAIWGPPIDRNNPGPGRIPIPESDQTSVPVENEVDEYGNQKIKYREALAEQHIDDSENAPVDNDGIIDLNYTDTAQSKVVPKKDEKDEL